MKESLEVQVGKITVAVQNLQSGFNELKADVKAFHEMYSRKLDEIAEHWTDVKSTYNGVVDIQREVNKHQEFIDENRTMLESIKEERQRRKTSRRDMLYKLAYQGILVLIGFLFSAVVFYIKYH